MDSPWSNYGLSWASLDIVKRRAQLAQALLRWDILPLPARSALRQHVLGLANPTPESADALKTVGLVNVDENGRCTPDYRGAALVALDELRRTLSPAAANELLAWYRQGHFRIRKTYAPFEAERPRLALEAFAELRRHVLVEEWERRHYRATLRGWAVARLVEDASAIAVADEDGPTLRWEAGAR